MKTLFTFFLVFLFPFTSTAYQYLYNPITNHRIEDGTNRTKLEILIASGLANQAVDYQIIILTSEEEEQVLSGDLTVVVENGVLVKKVVEKISTEQQQAAQAFEQLILTEFPQITKVEDLTPKMIDQYLLDHPLDKELIAKFMKAVLYLEKSRGR